MELSTKLKVKELKPGTIKVFKLINSGRPDPMVWIADKEGNKTDRNAITANAGAYFQGEATIYDEFEENPNLRRKTIKNIVGTTPVIKDGKTLYEDRTGPIEFDPSGKCIVRHSEYNKLVFLTRSNENAPNPFRDPSVEPLWEEVASIDKVAYNELERMEFESDALSIVRNADFDILQTIAKGLGVLIPKDPLELRRTLMFKAKELPFEVIRNSKNVDLKKKVQLKDAVDLRSIEINEYSQKWVFTDEKDASKQVICDIDPSEDPFQTLLKVILEDKEKYQIMANHLKAYKKSKESVQA